MSGAPALPEALAWLDYCLEETEAAMQAVKRIAGGDAGATENHQVICETAAQITTLRGRCARWKQHDFGFQGKPWRQK
jgi:hypothetical protein